MITRTWLQRGLLALLVGSVLAFGLRAAGTVANEVVTARGTVWLIDPPSGTVVQANALSRDVTAAVRVAEPRQQLSVAQTGSDAVVLNRSTGAVGLLDGATFDYRARSGLTGPGTDLSLVGNETATFALDTSEGRLLALDPTTLAVRFQTTVSAQQTTPAVADRDGRLWAFDGRLGELIRLDSRTGEVLRRVVTDPGSTAGLALVADRPVLVDGQAGAVLRLGEDGRAGQRLCRQNRELAGRLLVAGTDPGSTDNLAYALAADTGELLTADLDRNTCVRLSLGEDRGAVADGFGDPVVSKGRLFVPVFSRSQVLIVNGADNRIERTVDLRFAVPAGNRFELLVANGHLWFNDLQGARAGVLSDEGAILVVDKQQLNSVSGGPAGSGDTGEEGGTGLLDQRRAGGRGATGDGPGGVDVNGLRANGAGNLPGAGGGSVGSVASAGPTAPPGPMAVPAGPDPKPVPTPSSVPSQNDPLSANFSYSPPGDPTTLTELSFLDTSTGAVERREWTFVSPDGEVTRSGGRSVARTLPVVGSWTVTLTVFGAGGRSDTTVPVTLLVRDPAQALPPQANFSWDPATPVVRGPVQFTDRSTTGRTTPISAWLWEFGDGTVSTMSTPAPHDYATAGTYVVRLTVRNGVGAHSTEAMLRVAEPPAELRPEFTWLVAGQEEAPIAVGDVVSFVDRTSGGPTAWSWDFGDGAVGAAPSVTHVFRSAGDVVVRLTVGNGAGAVTLARVLSVAPPSVPPSAVVAEPADGASAEVNRPVRFVSGTIGSRTSLTWDFGDGSPAEDGAVVRHAFAAQGTFLVRLTAANAVGSTTAMVTVVVTDEPPPPPLLPGFRPSVGASAADPAVVGEPVRMLNTSIGTGTFAWSFGDGGASSEREPNYTYRRAGVFPVTLTMSDGVRSATVVGEVHVGPPPVEAIAAFGFSPANPVVGQAVQFVDRSSGTPLGWNWDFGDGSPPFAGQSPPARAFAQPGRYDVTLTVTDRAGLQSTATATVAVETASRAAPAASFAVGARDPGGLVTGTIIDFTDTTPSPYPLTTPTFTVEASPLLPPAGSRSVEHVFVTAGTYVVTMEVCWVEDPQNCAEATRELLIEEAARQPVADFTVSGAGVLPGTAPPVLLVGESVTFSDRSSGGDLSRVWTVNTDSSTASEVTVLPSGAGTLTVTLTVTNTAGSSSVTREFLVIAAAPTAAFAVSASRVAAGDTVTFVDEAPAGAVRQWDFGDGTAAEVTGAATVRHRFVGDGSFTVTLTVVLNGFSVSSTMTVAVAPSSGP